METTLGILACRFSFDGLVSVVYSSDYAKGGVIVKPVDDKFMENLERKRFNFVKWVSNVLISHQGPTFDELRVRFDLIKDSQRYIDKWIEIAMRMRVKRHAPKFTELYYYKLSSSKIADIVSQLSNYLPQLQTLRLNISSKIKNFNQYRKKESRFDKLYEVEMHPNKYLKKVEIVGFLGEMEEAEFLTYLVKSAINLEKIILHIDVLNLQIIYSEESADTTKQMAQNLARQLLKNRPGAELVLL
ncbi:hypothetical protein F3Y22_tig00008665pilonHSYRG00005 [Hibiscus syriacus]|uniref:FBD domain-containing protein n=1 Tax=Hibiscus syriacus TaxID=106335 RepID=A0A6A3CAD1_HIBSY|nr:hypothetical protein F3Y22_tig00008665pilonHSYRG00005 [Hibiscus syriacus]